MANLSLVDGHYRDGTKAYNNNGDNVQIAAEVSIGSDIETSKIYTPVVTLDGFVRELLEENNLLLKIMNKHLSTLSGIQVSEDEIELGDDDGSN